ncbi:hypothetical protein ABT147_02330 [Streptomyces sp. NPDC001868]|uniref:hypothetical protein n=1 Tax=Streptomyces sp. NPDC001868 TaxID=3154401 RepID=UPI0033216217
MGAPASGSVADSLTVPVADSLAVSAIDSVAVSVAVPVTDSVAVPLAVSLTVSAGYFAAQPSNSRWYAWRWGGRGSDRPLSQFFTVCFVVRRT